MRFELFNQKSLNLFSEQIKIIVCRMDGIYKLIENNIAKKNKLFAWLIDPDRLSFESLKKRLLIAQKSSLDYIFLGGSLLIKDKIDESIDFIKEYVDIPIILFPGNTLQINNKADAILFLSLISGRNPDFLIGKHVEIASILKRSSLEVLPVGYILIDTGLSTAVSYMSNTIPIPNNKAEIAVSTAIAGELLGLKLIFLEGGSGAKMPIPAEIIKSVKSGINIPLIVGGGINSADQLKIAYESGADIAVVGNAIENNANLIKEFSDIKNQLSNEPS